MKGQQTHFLERLWRILAVVLSAAALQACAAQMRSGIYLPEGDADKGRQAFAELKCDACHDVKGFDSVLPFGAATRVRLGGQTVRIKTYGDLVTSIVNPSHQIVRDYPREAVTTDGVSSKMSLSHVNAVMTVQQLVDVVAFLQSEYELVQPPFMPHWESYPTNEPGVFPRPRP